MKCWATTTFAHDFRQKVVPPPLDYAETAGNAERFFARKTIAFRGLCSAKSWASWTSYFIGRKITETEARRWLARMVSVDEIVSLKVVGRFDPNLEHDSGTLMINGFWLENEKIGTDADFAQALARGLTRLAKSVEAERVDVSVVKPPTLRRYLQASMKQSGLWPRYRGA
ncbi:MAG: hypothetical protein A2V98_19500 [Planctomycetes bacterium RBG_16_64_12]|nr:MAG: hypothetical protein A2V98_19500 [Planctomycetes bacterium RBG_16_64_12]